MCIPCGDLLDKKEKRDMEGGKSSDLPRVQARLSSPSAHFPLPSPSLLYSACSSKCMNAWMASQNTLHNLFLLDNLAFFSPPADNSLNSKPVNLEITYLTEILVLKNQIKKVDS